MDIEGRSITDCVWTGSGAVNSDIKLGLKRWID